MRVIEELYFFYETVKILMWQPEFERSRIFREIIHENSIRFQQQRTCNEDFCQHCWRVTYQVLLVNGLDHPIF